MTLIPVPLGAGIKYSLGNFRILDRTLIVCYHRKVIGGEWNVKVQMLGVRP